MLAGDIRSDDNWPSGRALVQAATYNERENIAALIARVLAVSPELQLLIIDDDSPDGTGEMALQESRTNPRLHVLIRRCRRGLGSAILEGFLVAKQLSRHLASWLVCWFTRFVLCVPVRDASSGFRAVRVAVFDRVTGPFSQGYAFQEDLLWRIHRVGGRLVEVPVTFTDRKLGHSKADFAESKRSISELLRIAVATWFGAKK